MHILLYIFHCLLRTFCIFMNTRGSTELQLSNVSRNLGANACAQIQLHLYCCPHMTTVREGCIIFAGAHGTSSTSEGYGTIEITRPISWVLQSISGHLFLVWQQNGKVQVEDDIGHVQSILSYWTSASRIIEIKKRKR